MRQASVLSVLVNSVSSGILLSSLDNGKKIITDIFRWDDVDKYWLNTASSFWKIYLMNDKHLQYEVNNWFSWHELGRVPRGTGRPFPYVICHFPMVVYGQDHRGRYYADKSRAWLRDEAGPQTYQ